MTKIFFLKLFSALKNSKNLTKLCLSNSVMGLGWKVSSIPNDTISIFLLLLLTYKLFNLN